MPGGRTHLDASLAPTLEALGLPPRQALHQLADAGFRAVQISALQPGLRPAELDRSACRDLLASLRRRELALGGIDCFLDPRGFLDAGLVDRTVGELVEAITLAGRLDRAPLCVVLPTECPVEVRAAAAALADLWGVPLADHQPAVNLAAGMRRGVDTAAWLAANLDLVATITSSGATLASVRLVDLLRSGMRGPVGNPHEGRLDLVLVRAALDAVRYRGHLVIDARQWAQPLEGMLESHVAWARAAGNLR